MDVCCLCLCVWEMGVLLNLSLVEFHELVYLDIAELLSTCAATLRELNPSIIESVHFLHKSRDSICIISKKYLNINSSILSKGTFILKESKAYFEVPRRHAPPF